MTLDRTDLHRRLTILEEHFALVSEQLAEVASALREPGIPPSSKLIEELTACHVDFMSIRDAVQHITGAALTSNGNSNPLVSLVDIKGLLNHLAWVDEQRSVAAARRDEAVAVLDRVLALTYPERPGFEPLVQCQSAASELRQVILAIDLPELHPDVQLLVAEMNPFSALLTLINSPADLLDEQYAQPHALVTEAFGISLAIAAYRGKLMLADRMSENTYSLNTPIEESEITNDDLNNDTIPEPPTTTLPYTLPSGTPSSVLESEGRSDSVMEQEHLPTEDHRVSELLSVASNVEGDAPCSSQYLEIDQQASLTINIIPDATIKGDVQDIEYGETTDVSRNSIGATIQIEAHTEPITEEAFIQSRTAEAHSDYDDGSAQQLASAILSNNQRATPALLSKLVVKLIDEDRLGLAYHLARYIESKEVSSSPLVPSLIIHTLTLGSSIQYDIGDIATLLKSDFTALDTISLSEYSSAWRDGLTLLLLAGTLRPALLAPNTSASTVIESLMKLEYPNKDKYSTLHDYCEIIANYGHHLHPLNPSTLKHAKSLATWEAEIDALREEVNQWSARATSKTIKYDPASKVWYHWQRPAGLIAGLLLPVRQNDTTKLDEIREMAERLSDPQILKREVNYVDRQVLGRRGGADIIAGALGQLRHYTDQAIDFVRQWITLQAARPDRQGGYLQQQAEQLRRDILGRQDAVLREIETHLQPTTDPIIRSGLRHCEASVLYIGRLLDEEIALLAEEDAPEYVLHAELLTSPLIVLNTDWEPEHTDESFERELLTIIAQGPIDWAGAIEAQSAVRNHEATGRIIQYLEACPRKDIDLDALIQARDKAFRYCQQALQRDVDDTRKQVEGAVAYGLLPETDRLEYVARIQAIETAIPITLQFNDKHAHLQAIKNDLAQGRASKIASTRQRLIVTNITPEHAAFERIDRVLATGDPLTANEYIDLVLANMPLPETDVVSQAFNSFFPQGLRDIMDYVESPHSRFDVQQTLKDLQSYARGKLRGYRLGPIDMYHLAGRQADHVAQMLRGWFSLKRGQRFDSKLAQEVLDNLGLTTQDLLVEKSNRRTWVTITTEPIRNKDLCPVWHYGSGADGRYRLLCVWDRPTEEDLLNDVGEMPHGPPVIVFYFGRMTEQRRRDLARLCRERRRTCLVVDDLLMLYLCGFRTPRLPILLECTLPFTFLEPYTTTAGLVPPEIFYGRTREREQIIDPMGSCFIFGGRQLGKTALLRDVERNFHAVREGRIGLWLDLKAEGIGYDRSIDEIWNLLGKELKKYKVIPAQVPPHTSPDKLLEYIQDWLTEDSSRRIILLLDEADRFLESDGKDEFQRASRIKGLMDKTNRRFKVVFAGLHNVKRTTRQENHPLAHYGEPICIGPLLENGEWREARALVMRPLASIGYQFESPDLVTRILSLTNYYPSLIQLYCTQLIRHVTDPHVTVFDVRTSPPYIILSRHVEEVYRSKELRDNIRQRFNLTLQLDRRYEVIAYSVAYGALSDDGQGLVAGFPLSWIREHAITWWSEGFRESATEDLFRALLDEMVGLGVLRIVSDDHYTLRSPNVVLLMGTQQEIETELVRPRETPLEYEPGTFRSAFRAQDGTNAVEPWRRSPLTAQQESELRSRSNKVSVIFGNEAAGLSELDEFLELAFGREFVLPVRQVADKVQFLQALDELDRREKHGTTLVLVAATIPWSETWITAAVERVQRLTSKTSFVRVAFVADPSAAWRLVGQNSAQLDSLAEQGVTYFTMRPWHDAALRQWLEDCGFGPSDPSGRARITAVTGNWPLLLREFHTQSRTDASKWEWALQTVAQVVATPGSARQLQTHLGLDQGVGRQIIQALGQYGEASTSDLVELHSNLPVELVHQAIRWADLLNLIVPVGGQLWVANPLVKQILEEVGG